uniref:Uncharacterized protein n=1 Tax=Lepeophtheirus salmonis TaxID=72036 RepID=A0A0K2TLM8_LEPSM
MNIVHSWITHSHEVEERDQHFFSWKSR